MIQYFGLKRGTGSIPDGVYEDAEQNLRVRKYQYQAKEVEKQTTVIATDKSDNRSMQSPSWTVFVDDNFHFLDETERCTLGTFDKYDQALSACQKKVDDFLNDSSATNAEDLLASFSSFGESPRLSGPTPEGETLRFSAWNYARERCAEIYP